MERRNVAAEQIEEFVSLLRKYEKDEKLTITDMTEEAGSKLGDNYMAILLRIRVTGKRGDTTPYQKNFMSKVYPSHRDFCRMMGTNVLFCNEAHMYKTVLPEIGPVGPRCVYVSDTKIIMEDLKDEGYTICDRLQFVDLEHCVYVIQELAQMHAISLSIKLKDPILFEKLVDPLIEGIFPAERHPLFASSFETCVEKARECITLLGLAMPGVKEAVELIGQYENKVYDTIQQLINGPKEKYFTLCHGDPWTNNLMFKHGSNGEIVDMKFIDYQICRHNSPAIDFHYFMFSSARESVFEEHYDFLVDTYHETFVKCLKARDVSQQHLDQLTSQWFRSQLKKYAVYGLFFSMMLIHSLMASGDDVIDMDKITMEDFAPENLKNFNIPVTKEKGKRLLFLCSHYLQKYC